MISIHNLNKSFKDKKVLDNLDITINDGEITALYGDVGCGKSTVAKILCGVLDYDSGEITIDGNSLYKNGKYDRGLGIKIQLVYQQPFASLDPTQKIISGLYELIRYHKLAKREDRNSLIRNLCNDVALPFDILSHYPHQISGGEAQRVAILRALLLNPDVLILDEATSMLDVITQSSILNMLKTKYMNDKRSIVLISHDYELVKLISNKIYEL